MTSSPTSWWCCCSMSIFLVWVAVAEELFPCSPNECGACADWLASLANQINWSSIHGWLRWLTHQFGQKFDEQVRKYNTFMGGPYNIMGNCWRGSFSCCAIDKNKIVFFLYPSMYVGVCVTIPLSHHQLYSSIST